MMIARTVVVNEYNNEDNTFYKVQNNRKPILAFHDTRIVLFAYILGGWKATVISTLPDYHYYEVTYDKVKDRIYVDTYVKRRNVELHSNFAGRKVRDV